MCCELHNARFTYLSACHTTVDNEASPDEVIHLAAAMQFAGFRSVIGTMWAADDGHANEITSTFYRCMLDAFGRLDNARAALALHRMMNGLRLSKIPFDQRNITVPNHVCFPIRRIVYSGCHLHQVFLLAYLFMSDSSLHYKYEETFGVLSQGAITKIDRSTTLTKLRGCCVPFSDFGS